MCLHLCDTYSEYVNNSVTESIEFLCPRIIPLPLCVLVSVPSSYFFHIAGLSFQPRPPILNFHHATLPFLFPIGYRILINVSICFFSCPCFLFIIPRDTFYLPTRLLAVFTFLPHPLTLFISLLLSHFSILPARKPLSTGSIMNIQISDETRRRWWASRDTQIQEWWTFRYTRSQEDISPISSVIS